MRTVPRPCTRHRRPDARNEIAGTSPRRQPEGRTVFGLSLFTPTGACLSLGQHASGRQHPASTDEGKKQHLPLQSTRPRPPHQPGSPCRDSTCDTPLPCTKALRRPRATRSGAAREESTCSTPLPLTRPIRHPRTPKRGRRVKASGTVRKTLRPGTRSLLAPHASARLRFARVQFRK